MNIISKEKFVITHPKDENGEEIKYRFMLSVSRRLRNVSSQDTCPWGAKLVMDLYSIDGVDAIVPNVGVYTVEVGVARTFDPYEVITEIERVVTEALSEIIKPKIIL
jgi:hypothetical protein